MEGQAAQNSTAPADGASNATDFQPTTQNPQNVPTNVFQQQGGLQDVTNTQEFLNEQRDAQISITTQPAAAPAVAEARQTPVGLILLSIIFVIVAVVLFKLSNRIPAKSKPALTPTEEPAVEEPAAAATSTKPSTSTAPKKTVKKSKKSSKKAKRRNR